VLKAVALIDVLARSSGELTLTELATETGQPVPTVHRLLATLEYAGWLTRNNRGYSLSVRMAELAGSVLSGISVRTEALRPMQELTSRTGETSYLSIRQGDAVLCVERVESMNMVRVMSWDVGKLLPLRVGGGALAMLAFLGAEEAERVVAETKVHETMPHATGDAALLKSLIQIREQGFAVSTEEIIPGISSIGAPVFGQAGQLVAAVSIGGLTPALMDDLDRMSTEVVAAAVQISRNLGYLGSFPAVWPLAG
jgi:DNA-binding IclR family transcriptional regulator